MLTSFLQGILFLTTNRSDNLDPAFEPCIPVSLTYKSLDTASRRQIWSQLLTLSAKTERFTDSELDELTTVELNGRQIKNVLKTAGFLAWSQEGELTLEHVKALLDLRDSNALKDTESRWRLV